MGCFTWLVLLVGFVVVMMSLIRWFEQATEAVEIGWWNKVFVLLAMPFTVWLFPSRVSAGRPTMAPRHEPVRGFGRLPKGGIVEPVEPVDSANDDAAPPATSTASARDQPPPGTPAAFLVMPAIPPPRPKSPRPAVDPEKIAQLRQKMRDQGMLPPDDAG